MVCCEQVDRCLLGCVLYVSVLGLTASSFTIVASLDVLDSGMTVDSPPSVARNYVFSGASFGAPLPVLPLSAALVVADPWLACAPLSAESANAVAGKVALVMRGQCTFLEKALNVQAAGAVALIVSNYNPSPISMAPLINEAITCE